ncbi:MAG: hypothetical protein KDD51_12780, partial [Bdellovibrionales bacterium]|nr:hypothetical protein [Bdellovibrionales bacterium]
MRVAVISLVLFAVSPASAVPRWENHFGIRSVRSRSDLRSVLEAAQQELRALASLRSADTAQRAYEFLGFLAETRNDVFLPELAWEVAALIYANAGVACTDENELTTHSAFPDAEVDFSANMRENIERRCVLVMSRVLDTVST